VDQVGALVWSVLDGTSSLRDIATDVADVFGAPLDVVAPDLLSLVQTLGRAGLLDGVSTKIHHTEEHVHAHG
jgi:pyrroloquinoline quinone biosynthesis protein D